MTFPPFTLAISMAAHRQQTPWVVKLFSFVKDCFERGYLEIVKDEFLWLHIYIAKRYKNDTERVV